LERAMLMTTANNIWQQVTGTIFDPLLTVLVFLLHTSGDELPARRRHYSTQPYWSVLCS